VIGPKRHVASVGQALIMSWPTVFYRAIGAIKANTCCVYCL